MIELNQHYDIKSLTSSSVWPIYKRKTAAYGIVPYINELGSDVRGIELGICWGINSYMLLESCPNITTLVGIDHYKAYQDWDREIPQHEQDHNYAKLVHNMTVMGPRFQLLKLNTKDAAAELENDSFDFVFIDADHSMKSVLHDLDSYWPKIKTGGIVAGHDANLFSVNFAVTSWAKRHGIDPETVNIVENQAWYFFKK